MSSKKTKDKFNIGDMVVKVLKIGPYPSTGSFCYVISKNKDFISISDEPNGDPFGHHIFHAYHKNTGNAYENNIPDFLSKILTLKEALDQKITIKE